MSESESCVNSCTEAPDISSREVVSAQPATSAIRYVHLCFFSIAVAESPDRSDFREQASDQPV